MGGTVTNRLTRNAGSMAPPEIAFKTSNLIKLPAIRRIDQVVPRTNEGTGPLGPYKKNFANQM